MWPRSSTPRVTSMLRLMPSRSSRSRPASRTSCSEPTGPASLAIAIGLRLSDRVEDTADLAQPVARLLVAQRACDAGLEGGARRETERGGRLVVARQVGVEHRRVVGRDRAADAGRHEL